MERENPVPEADAIEQDEPSADKPDELQEVSNLGEKPEADAYEQAQAVEEVRTRVVVPPRDDVPEADWLEQSVAEPLDEDEPR